MVEAYGLSDPGCVRKNNEDYYLVEPELGLYLVADGMGGAAAGEHASKAAAEAVRDVVRESSNGRSSGLLSQAFEEANRRVRASAASDTALEGMGTTLVAVLDCENSFEIASVGDSRCYQFQNDKLTGITEDQTWVQEVGRRLGIAEDQLRVHPMRHVLTMAIGASHALKIHTYSIPKPAESLILLCSDGLHGVVSETIIAETLGSQRTLRDKSHYLIDAARSAGGPDNITAVLVEATR